MFSKYRAHSRELAGSSEFSSLSASGVQTGQNVLDDSQALDTALLRSNWNSLRRNSFSKIPTDINVLSCRTRAENISPALHTQNSSQHVRACAAGNSAICPKNRKIVSYHRDSPNTRNGTSLRSPAVPDYGFGEVT